jgi:hypothetical protein
VRAQHTDASAFFVYRGGRKISKRNLKGVRLLTQVAGASFPLASLTSGVSSLWRLSPSYENLALSLIHSSLTPSL